MKLDQGDETEGVSGTGWLCSTRHPERILPDNTHFVEKNVGWILACHTHRCIMLQKNVLSEGLIRTLVGLLPCTYLGKKKKRAEMTSNGCGHLLL